MCDGVGTVSRVKATVIALFCDSHVIVTCRSLTLA